MKQIILSVIIVFQGLLLLGQEGQYGTVSGTIIDGESDETIIGGTVVIKGTTKGTITDFDGNFTLLNVPVGTYTIEVQYISYENYTQEITVLEGENTIIKGQLLEATTSLAAVVIKAKRKTNTENALVVEQKKADVVQNGISKQEMARTASSNAAEGMKKVTGVSIQGGKYAAIRGMDGRYISTSLNGITIPNTDPERNSAQLDLIPTSVLDNIIITKTFMPDQPGTTTGGGINIKTKDFPSKFYLNFSSSIGFNSQSYGKDDFLTYQGGANDWMGYDDGTRNPHPYLLDTTYANSLTNGAAIKSRKNDSIANEVDEIAKSISKQMVPTKKQTPIDRSVSLSFGNTYKVFKKRKLGYSLNMNFKKSHTYYKDGLFRDFENKGDTSSVQIEKYDFVDQRMSEKPSLGGLGIISFEIYEDNSITFRQLYNHNAEKYARTLQGEFPAVISNPDAIYHSNVLSFNEREINAQQLVGEHRFNFLDSTALHGLELDWKVSKFEFEQDEPDLRFFSYDYNPIDTSYYISRSEYTLPTHFYRNMTDKELQGKVDVKLPIIKNKGEKNYIKFGALRGVKIREFRENTFQVDNRNRNLFTDLDGDVDAYFADSSFGIIGQDSRERNIIGNFITDASDPRNIYSGQTAIDASYLMSGIDLTKRLRLITGVRVESFHYKIQRPMEDTMLVDQQATDVLPSLNFIYNLKKDGNAKLRTSLTQTVARPTLREISPFSSRQFIGGPFFVGNADLLNTKITNLDIRFERYFKRGQLLSLSTYAKQFDHPIIRTFKYSANDEITWINVDKAKLIGFEFEGKKQLYFIHKSLKNFKVTGNLTYVLSEVKTDSIQNDVRIFPSQSKYLYNTDLVYNNDSIHLLVALSLNYFDDRINSVGQSVDKDEWEIGQYQLNFVLNKGFGKHFSIRLSAKNLLNALNKRFENYRGEEYVKQSFYRGRSYTIGFSYKI